MPAPDDPLAPLTVIDRLEVGPVRLEPRRLSAPYRVVRQGRTDAIELQYSYEQDVFDPADPAARNLAAVTAAQVALNYGLFCRRIVLHGRYDDTDRRFLTEMARNTAREIYVNKLLEPNPFLVGAAVGLPAVRRESYLRAELQFEPEQPGAEADEAGRSGEWAVDRSRHVVLSSGGKDSLLSQGLLDEIGVETHPVFVNESGRHWFTALNAYRHFAEHVPNTSRVWTNSDRVFARLLRHLPFVRPDFAGVRSDEYPIRLWTVAVFIFGALPVLRRRGIGRLVIGDEYDTTLRRSHRGITHYDGLYDQSRWFDNALTRYYRQKRWNVAQFSILRPLSELLIEKVLTARYPHLQRHQTSCHATHTEEHRVRPCGRCEKCHRIVGMLKALDADPTVCGYTPQQIDRCLNELPGRALHQEAEVTQQLAVMLWQRGLIPEPSLGALEHPEVLKLRFDPQRSPIDTIPTDLRGPLYTILMEQADGAVRRHGKVWIDYDPLNDPTLSRPYAFESPARGPRPAARNNGADPAAAGGSVLGEFTWPQARQRLQEVDVALLPVGAIEQHGPHLPLDTDAFDAAYLARKVAEGCTEPRPLVLPLIPYGVSYHHDDFSGTISISNDTMSRLVYEIGIAAARNGVTKLVVINGHGGNAASLHFAAQMINRDTHIFTCVDSGETSDLDIEALIQTPNDVHAGEIETSTALANRPELVRMKHARKSVPRFTSRYLDFSSKRSVDWYARTARISASGVMGDPTQATAEKGRRIWEIMIRHLVEFVDQLKGMTLDEIHQKSRY